MRLLRTSVWITFLLAVFIPCHGQQRYQKPLAVLPFRLVGSGILIAVTIDRHPDTLHFLFDSGSEITTLSTSLADKLGLKRQKEAGLSGWSKGMIRLPVAQANQIRLGGLSIPYPKFYLRDMQGARVGNTLVDGILGYDLLKRYVVAIDFQERKMSLYRGGPMRYPPGGELLPLGMNYRTPTVIASLDPGDGQPLSSTYHVITGGDFGLLLNGAYVSKYRLDRNLSVQGTVSRADLVKPVTFTKYRVPVFTLGKIRLTDVPALYSSRINDDAPDKEIAGAIGAAIWQQFNLFINLPAKELYLIPHKR